MSGLAIGLSNLYKQDLLQKLSFVPASSTFVQEFDKLNIGGVRVDDPSLWGPAHDSTTGVYVALGGRLAYEEEEWQKAREMNFSGGLACRLVLDAWLKSPEEIVDKLNGTYCVVIYDPRDSNLHIWTDRMGAYPMYYCSNGHFLLCSHTDVLANQLLQSGVELKKDMITLAESISTASSVFPNTFYQEIKELAPSSHYTWHQCENGVTLTNQEEYWRPRYLDYPTEQNEELLVQDLAQAFRSAMRRRTCPTLGKTGLFLSAGADSRSLLFGASKPTEIECMTFFDQYNIEVDSAKHLSDIAGANHHLWQRDLDYYPKTAEDSMKIAGGMWSFIDCHYLGFLSKISELGLGAVYSGCTADYLFKGLSHNRKYRTLLGKTLPLYDFDKFDFAYYHSHIALSEKWQNIVKERLESRFPKNLRTLNDHDRLAVEDLRIRPISREADFAGRAILLRTLPWDNTMMDRDILNVYGRIPARFKLNGILFGKVVAELTGKEATKVYNNNYCASVNASEFQRTCQFLKGVARRKFEKLLKTKKALTGCATTGSWPDWAYVIENSDIIKKSWGTGSSTERDFFNDMLGYDPWSKSLTDWSCTNHILFARIYSQLLWLRQRNWI